METRSLGSTGLIVSAVGFGCGAIGGLMVKGAPAAQRRAVERAVEAGFRYFDTAPSYGDGRSEENLGRVLDELRADVVVGTKLRVDVPDVADARDAVRRSVEASLRRLRRDRVHLLQVHNRIGGQDGLAADAVLGPVLEAMREVRDAGLAEHIGITALGETGDIVRVVEAGAFETAQVYFNVLNPSAGWAGRVDEPDQDFRGAIDRAAERGMGVITIRALAAGAVAGRGDRHPNAGHPGGAPLGGMAYSDDLSRAGALESLARQLGLEGPVELAVRFALAKAGVSTVLIGFSDESQLEDAIRWSSRGPLPADAVDRVLALRQRSH